MAGPFARLRRGESSEPAPDAPTETQDAVTTQAPAVDATAPVEPAPTTEQPPVSEDATPEPVAAAEPVPPADTVPGDETPGFIERGKLRRRLRFVRRARELALRDLGGLVFDLHRFGRERNDLVEQKLGALATLDSEMRALQTLLDDHPEVTVLHEPGVASCPRCGALHASDAAYCSACGLPVGRGVDLPSGPALTGPVPPTPAAATAPVDQPTEITPPPSAHAEREPEPEPDPTDPADVPVATEAVPEGEPQEHPTTAS
jgi:hypothetical protein